MTGFFHERREDCGHTTDWTIQGVRDVASLLGDSDTHCSTQPSADAMSAAFLSALRSRDVSKATEICQLSGNWSTLAMGAITQLDEAWQDDTLSIGEIAETYWTLRRTLDELTSNSVRNTAQSLSIGKAVVCIPSSEQHTFGPQMLVDRIGRIGWDAQLWHDIDAAQVMERVSSQHIDVLGISVGTDTRLDGLSDMISSAKQNALNRNIKILIGGCAICGASNQYGFLGADWIATSSEEAIAFFGRGWSELERREGRFDG